MKINIEPLQSDHDIESFSCGVPALEQWLRQIARQHARKGISRTYVAVDPDRREIVRGYYSVTVGEAHSPDLPQDLARKLPKKIPIVLIGRLAVATDMQGKGLGSVLLVDALARIVRISEEVGISAILVDAKNSQAVKFYRHHGFLPLPGDANRLVLPVSTVKVALQ
ncbi:MAG TPA: GNAT family N-acetyltransferase [Burkholderiales bacterium]|nr:GNAT family N-acetyltransferase [Burkholderiales bacterium]